MADSINKYKSTYSAERLSAYAYQENDTMRDIIINYSNNIQKRFKSDNFVTTNIIRFVGLLILIFGIVLFLNPKNMFKEQ